MPTISLYVDDRQQAAIAAAAEAAGLPLPEYVLHAVRVDAALRGIVIPERVTRVQRPPRPRRSSGGRPPKPLGEAERDEVQGEFVRICRQCGRKFRTDNPRTAYCSQQCKTRRMNRANYMRRTGKASR